MVASKNGCAILFASLALQFSLSSQAADICDAYISKSPEETFEISDHGTYCLEENLIHSGVGPAILVRSDSVNLDLKNFQVSGSEVGVGIKLDDNLKNINIENGKISKFNQAIVAGGIKNIIIKKLFIENISWIGVLVANGTDVSILENKFLDIGGGEYNWLEDDYAVAIQVRGDKINISGNNITEIYSRRDKEKKIVVGEGVGVIISDHSKDVVFRENAIFNSRTSDTIGIFFRLDNITLHRNRFFNMNVPVAGHVSGSYVFQSNKITRKFNSKQWSGVKTKLTPNQTGVSLSVKNVLLDFMDANTIIGYDCPVVIKTKSENAKIRARISANWIDKSKTNVKACDSEFGSIGPGIFLADRAEVLFR